MAAPDIPAFLVALGELTRRFGIEIDGLDGTGGAELFTLAQDDALRRCLGDTLHYNHSTQDYRYFPRTASAAILEDPRPINLGDAARALIRAILEQELRRVRGRTGYHTRMISYWTRHGQPAQRTAAERNHATQLRRSRDLQLLIERFSSDALSFHPRRAGRLRPPRRERGSHPAARRERDRGRRTAPHDRRARRAR